MIVHTDSEYSDDYDEEKPTKVDLDSDHATDDQNNDTSNDGAAIKDEKEKPTNFMSELASKLGGPQQKKKDKAVVESVSITIYYYLVNSGVIQFTNYVNSQGRGGVKNFKKMCLVVNLNSQGEGRGQKHPKSCSSSL